MAVLHLMVGLPCSGKTTYARRLATTANALLLTPDAWYLKLFDNDAGHPDHDRKHSQIEAIMLDVARQALMLGCNVILDFGFWAVQEREALRHMALSLGAQCRLHYMDVPIDELYRRLDECNRLQPEGTFYIPTTEMDAYIRVFQPPTPEELARFR